jgi:16S rRNA (guanine(527)-N(7))-methyltransferase RsmG
VKNPKTINLEENLRGTERSDGTKLSESEVGRLSLYYDLVLKWNPRLNLTTVTSPSDFVERHLGESEFAAGKILDAIDEVWDLGTGLGIPGIPIAIFRPDLEVKLVESNRAKAIFLEEAVSVLQLANVEVVRKRIESLAELPELACLTLRAVEQMEKVLLDVLSIGAVSSQILLFGNRATESLLRDLAGREGRIISSVLPGSDRRLLIEFIRFT